ncbi:MAG: hypothetical protein PHD67_08770 [Oscillospiraceae bacterium]|nr:hypothetical protein [Oscillospiraceae bacterium]
MKVTSRDAAWAEVNKIFPTDYEKDDASSIRAGYDIYRHPTLNYYNRICDLGCRLEVLLGECGENVTNIWIEEPTAETTKQEKTKGYGEQLAEKIRATANTGNLPQFEKFVLDRGWEFPTEEGLKAAYDRLWKSCHGILLSKEEFMAEANRRGTKEHSEELYAGMLYDAIAELAKEKKLDPCMVYQYARFRWCFNQPDAVVAYQTDRERWSVNNCDTEITTERAVVEVNQEWGFEASRVKILDNPYYESTDWNWIRFDCAGMSWLMCNGSLLQVYH